MTQGRGEGRVCSECGEFVPLVLPPPLATGEDLVVRPGAFRSGSVRRVVIIGGF